MAKYVAWWSAGVTSAIACKLAIEEFGVENVDLIYFQIASAHKDNQRFKEDCEKWYGKEIESVRGEFEDQFDVIEDSGFINGPSGARCTIVLKKRLRQKIQRKRDYSGQIFGFDYSPKEVNRALRFLDQYPETNPIFPLIRQKLTKPKCLQLLTEAGIEIPAMYKLGYPNNNCIGCVKGGSGYWNKIRVDFPEEFERMAELERYVGRSCIREYVWDGTFKANGEKRKTSQPIWLDELDPNRGQEQKIIMPDCGSMCDIKYTEIEHPRLHELMG